MFLLAIHSDTIANWLSPIVTPNSGNTFSWRRVFHVTTSLQNLYIGHNQLTNADLDNHTVTYTGGEGLWKLVNTL